MVQGLATEIPFEQPEWAAFPGKQDSVAALPCKQFEAPKDSRFIRSTSSGFWYFIFFFTGCCSSFIRSPPLEYRTANSVPPYATPPCVVLCCAGGCAITASKVVPERQKVDAQLQEELQMLSSAAFTSYYPTVISNVQLRSGKAGELDFTWVPEPCL